MEQYKQVDWDEVLERLTLEALRLFNASRFAAEERILPSFGDGFEDLPQNVILDLIDERRPSVSWSKTRGAASTDGVVAYLRTVLRNDFCDRIRSQRLQRQRSITGDADDVVNTVEPPDPQPPADDTLIRREAFDRALKRLDDDFKARPDDDLQLYLMLQFDGIRHIPYSPREAAAELGIDVKQVYLLKERLERRINRLFKNELLTLRPQAHERPYDEEARQ